MTPVQDLPIVHDAWTPGRSHALTAASNRMLEKTGAKVGFDPGTRDTYWTDAAAELVPDRGEAGTGLSLRESAIPKNRIL